MWRLVSGCCRTGCGCAGLRQNDSVLEAEHEVTTTRIRDEALALGQLGHVALEMMRSVFAPRSCSSFPAFTLLTASTT
jgi:hypothetical protein